MLDYKKSTETNFTRIEVETPIMMAYVLENISASLLEKVQGDLESRGFKHIHRVHYALDDFGVILCTSEGALESGTEPYDYFDDHNDIVTEGDNYINSLELPWNQIAMGGVVYGDNETDHNHLTDHVIETDETGVYMKRILNGEPSEAIMTIQK